MSWHTNLYKKLKVVDEEELHRLIERQLREYNPDLKAMADRKIEISQILDQKDLTPEERLALIEANKQRFVKYQNNSFITSPSSASPIGQQQHKHLYPLEDSTRSILGLPTISKFEETKGHSSFPESGTATSASENTLMVPETIHYKQPASPPTPASHAYPPLPEVQSFHENRLKKLIDLIHRSDGSIGWDPKTGEIVLEGKKIENSSFHDLLRELYERHKSHLNPPNLIGFDRFLDVVSRLMSPGGKWEKIPIKSIIPRRTYQRKIRQDFMNIQEGKGKRESIPPGQKIKILRLY